MLGLNGCGKTTLIKLLTRLYDPSKGVILLDGVDIREYDLKDFMFDTLDYIDSEDLVKTNINEFILTGDSFNTKVSDIKLEKEFKEYTDSVEFLDMLYSVMPTYY